MKEKTNHKRFILSVIAALLLAIVIPSTSFAQGRGQGKGHNKGDWSDRVRNNGDWTNRDRNRSWRYRSSRTRHLDKKCGKFVNCHDARDGRIDGRGPRGTRVSSISWRNRLRNRNTNNVWRNRNGRTVRRVIVNR